MSKKKIIAIISIIVLLFAAGISVGVFLYGRAESEATDGNQIQGTPEQDKDADGNQSTDQIQTDNSASNPNEGTANVNGAEGNGNSGNAVQGNNTGNIENTVQDNNTGDTGVTTGTNTDEVGETTIFINSLILSVVFFEATLPISVLSYSSSVNPINRKASLIVGLLKVFPLAPEYSNNPQQCVRSILHVIVPIVVSAVKGCL